MVDTVELMASDTEEVLAQMLSKNMTVDCLSQSVFVPCIRSYHWHNVNNTRWPKTEAALITRHRPGPICVILGIN